MFINQLVSQDHCYGQSLMVRIMQGLQAVNFIWQECRGNPWIRRN
jgi:hypothetical protein